MSRRTVWSKRLLIVLTVAALATPLAAQPNNLPQELEGLGVTQRLGEVLPLSASFVDDSGDRVVLNDIVTERPTILALVYYDCPMLCDMVMDGVARTLKAVEFTPGEDFDVVAVSFDPSEGPSEAVAAKQRTLENYGRQETAAGWHFLTGDEQSIREVTEAAGFSYRLIEETGEYAHAAAIVVVTPEGKLARYFYGIDYPPRDLRLALIEASENRIGSVVDQVMLYCFRYDPKTGQYSVAIWRIVRLAGALTAIALISFLWINHRRDHQARPAEA